MVFFFFFWLWGMQDLSSQTRDQTLTLCIGRHITVVLSGKFLKQTNKQTNRNSFMLSARAKGRYTDSPCISCHHTYTSAPIINITHRNDASFAKEEPAQTHQNHRKSVLDVKVHSWWRASPGFRQVHHDVYPSLNEHTKHFLTPDTALGSPVHPSLAPTSDNHRSFAYLHSFTFSRMSHNWSHTVCNLFRLAYFT